MASCECNQNYERGGGILEHTWKYSMHSTTKKLALSFFIPL